MESIFLSAFRLFTVFALLSALPAFASQGPLIQDLIDQANGEAKSSGFPARELTNDDLLTVLRDAEPFMLLRSEQDDLESYLQEGRLPPHSSIEWVSYSPDSPPEPVLKLPRYSDVWIFELPLMDGNVLSLETERARAVACDTSEGYDLCREPFESGLPLMGTVAFPQSVPVQVTPFEIGNDPDAQRDALRVRILLRPDNLDDVASYFAVGYSFQEVRDTAGLLLGNRSEFWIDVQDLWTRWIGAKVNTFPSSQDNDVCHAPAREFFFYRQTPVEAGNARSTEAVEVLLHDNYCPVPDGVEPRFGDFLWVPGRHSGRYVLKDPATGRGVSFSIQSGGNIPYRLYWVDEDFSRHPFGHSPEPGLRQSRLDVWRRCR